MVHPQMDGVLGAIAHFLHYAGFAVGFGASIAGSRAHAKARSLPAPAKAGSEEAAAAIIAGLSLPGWFVAVGGGLVAVVANPSVLDPRGAGGPWLHIKLVVVFALLFVVHLRMFKAKALVRERGAGANESELDALLGKTQRLAMIEQGLALLVFFLATFRFVLFA